MFAGTAGTSRSRIDGEDDDVESCCSTCSSSSSSDEAAAYALPPRRAYGGVRISYVPNDAVACARKRAPASSSSSNQAQRDTEKCVVSWWLLLPCFTSFNIVPSSWLFGEKRNDTRRRVPKVRTHFSTSFCDIRQVRARVVLPARSTRARQRENNTHLIYVNIASSLPGRSPPRSSGRARPFIFNTPLMYLIIITTTK